MQIQGEKATICGTIHDKQKHASEKIELADDIIRVVEDRDARRVTDVRGEVVEKFRALLAD